MAGQNPSTTGALRTPGFVHTPHTPHARSFSSKHVPGRGRVASMHSSSMIVAIVMTGLMLMTLFDDVLSLSTTTLHHFTRGEGSAVHILCLRGHSHVSSRGGNAHTQRWRAHTKTRLAPLPPAARDYMLSANSLLPPSHLPAASCLSFLLSSMLPVLSPATTRLASRRRTGRTTNMTSRCGC